MLSEIDRLSLHPRNKLLLYKRYVLSKKSWHLTVADLSVTWVKNNVDNNATKFIRSWFRNPYIKDARDSGKSKFGLGLILPFARFTQCQVTFRSLKNSKNSNIRKIHTNTSIDTNIQCDRVCKGYIKENPLHERRENQRRNSNTEVGDKIDL